MGHALLPHVLRGCWLQSREDRRPLSAAFHDQNVGVLDLPDDDLANLHLRYMIGGRSALACDERLYRFEFPERPGALPRFLERMHPHWNISLFHYRNHGVDHGRILVGIQVPTEEQTMFHRFLGTLGYPPWDEILNLT